jgi:DNA polymerase kappa
MEFVAKLPIGKVNGVGRVSERTLKALEINTCQDIGTKRVILYQLLSKKFFDFLLRV